ncbi:alpha/beta fold hydrolase [Amycolatopsis saalfeldensis]|uniref:Pimeloyl-ACP methyl ester carboxylesterase n=1 Tax=Amycolatopsis saalfeldensis TaxID=394193 RepID=A0A1H8YI15_9PSEU|nr:alpha/beta fold hydrolase [Amycolatopsis saalfeldensis]SEP51864.1 Pimeloyl-ACP methyl ester carboxylesterase [Amycolatopsis saalfeldensis]
MTAPLHVREDGPPDAPVVLLVHGFCGSVRSYDRLVPLLADDYRVVRVDLRGHGSTGGHAGLDAFSQASALARALKELGCSAVTAVGHSFGADVVLALAEQTGLVERVVVIGQAPDYSYATFPPGHGLLPWVGGPLRLLASLPWVRRFGADFAATSPAMDRTVLVDRRHALAARPLDVQLRELGLPALVILGARDTLYDCAKTAARYAAVGARVEVVAGAGHSVAGARPAEVALLLRKLLADG